MPFRSACWPVCYRRACYRSLPAPTSLPSLTRRENAWRQRSTLNRAGSRCSIARDGKIVFEGGYGLADLENKTPVTTETKFRIGSVSKQFTAAAILKLSEEGKLALSDPLTKYYPDYPHAEGVTIEQLLTHTSGLRSYTDKPEFKGRVTQAIEPDKLIEWVRSDDPDFAPARSFITTTPATFCSAKSSAKSLASRWPNTCRKRSSIRWR